MRKHKVNARTRYRTAAITSSILFMKEEIFAQLINKIFRDQNTTFLYLTVYEKFEKDEIFQRMEENQKIQFISEYLLGQRQHLKVEGMYVNNISYCPTCDEERITSRCACMCGSCLTCGYEWTCFPILIDDYYSSLPETTL